MHLRHGVPTEGACVAFSMGRQEPQTDTGYGLHFALGGLDEWGLHIGVNCVYTLVNSMKDQAVDRVFLIVCLFLPLRQLAIYVSF